MPSCSLTPLRGVLAAAILLGYAPVAQAKEVAPDRAALARLDGYTTALADIGSFSGVVLVAHGGRILFEAAYGPRDVQNPDERATILTRYNIASAGKMFTATAILQMIEAGKLSLDTTVGEVLTDYPNEDFATKVEIRHLLTHMAGAGDVDIFGSDKAEIRARILTHTDMVRMHWDRAPAFEPGTEQVYGNFGHVVLARIVEVLSGKDFYQYIGEHIFQPSGMTATGFDDCSNDRKDTAVGYVVVNGQTVRNCLTQPARGFAAGGEYSSAQDLLRFVQAAEKGRLFSKTLFAAATQTQFGFSGLGFFATGYGDDVPKRDFRWGHAGSSDGVCADVRTYPLTGETIIVLANQNPPTCHDVAGFLHRAYQEQHKPF